jgi:alkylhydroperoxidase family enzyme
MAIDRTTSLPAEWGITLEMMENPATRVPFVEPENVPEEIREALDPHYRRSLDKWGSVPRYFQMLGHSPVIVEAWMLLDENLRMGYLNTDPQFLKMQQLVIVKTAIMNHSINCTGHNIDLARAVGVTWEQLDLLEGDDWKDSDLFSDKEKAVLQWAEEVTDQGAYDNDAAFEELKQYFTTRQVVELTFLCCMWNLSGRLTEALHLMVEPPGERIGFGCSI